MPEAAARSDKKFKRGLIIANYRNRQQRRGDHGQQQGQGRGLCSTRKCASVAKNICCTAVWTGAGGLIAHLQLL